MITQEEMKWLEAYENNFICATKANYTRNIPQSQLARMKEIYEREKGVKFNLCTHCSSSILRLVKAMAVLYNENKEMYGREKEQGEIEQDKGTREGLPQASDTNPKKKRPRKQKDTDM